MDSETTSNAVLFKPDNRLAAILGDRLAPPAWALTARAEARMQGLRDQIRQFVRARRAELLALADLPETALLAEREQLGAAARSICEVAGAAGWRDLGEAARGVCVMLDAYQGRGAWRFDALKLHLDAISLLGAEPSVPAAAAAQVLDRLKTMRERVGVAE